MSPKRITRNRHTELRDGRDFGASFAETGSLCDAHVDYSRTRRRNCSSAALALAQDRAGSIMTFCSVLTWGSATRHVRSVAGLASCAAPSTAPPARSAARLLVGQISSNDGSEARPPSPLADRKRLRAETKITDSLKSIWPVHSLAKKFLHFLFFRNSV